MQMTNQFVTRVSISAALATLGLFTGAVSAAVDQRLPLVQLLGMTESTNLAAISAASVTAAGTIFDPPTVTDIVVRDDIFGADPLAQNQTGGLYLNNPFAMPFTFPGRNNTVAAFQYGGINLANPGDAVFAIDSAEKVMPNGDIIIGVRITSSDVNGQLRQWIAPGVGGNGYILTSWRMDVGMGAAYNDPINLKAPVEIIGARVFMMTVQNTFFDQRPIFDYSTATTLAGVTSFGNGSSDADIAGFNISQFVMEWTVHPTAVPEPAALGLIGFAGLALVRRRGGNRPTSV
jgi:MYXO-CTERM domain-containing protein